MQDPIIKGESPGASPPLNIGTLSRLLSRLLKNSLLAKNEPPIPVVPLCNALMANKDAVDGQRL